MFVFWVSDWLDKFQKQHFKSLFFSNPGDKVMILVKSRGYICPILFTLFRILTPGLENTNTLKCLKLNFSNYLDMNICVEKFSKQHFNVWLFSNPGDKFLFLLKFYEVRISEWNILFWLQKTGKSLYLYCLNCYSCHYV